MIPFNKPHLTGQELGYIAQAHANGAIAGDGVFSRRCEDWLKQATGVQRAMLTHSCTAALEMCALLADIGPGDEVIMPSFTFVSTANAFVLRGATPVFVEIRADTLNIDENLIEAAITERTRAIVVVHYAGIACAMDAITAIAKQHGLLVIEDAAQGIMSRYQGKPLGSIGSLGAFSFHETKNLTSGEGGALLINDARFIERAEIIREKGTDRSRFYRGQIDKYTWCDIGSSYLPGELVAAFLWAQIEQAEAITRQRVALWESYHAAFAGIEAQGWARRPVVPSECEHNGHLYYLLLATEKARASTLDGLRKLGISAVFHYVPLHQSPAGRRFGRSSGDLKQTSDLASRLIRLPMWIGLADLQDQVIEAIHACARTNG